MDRERAALASCSDAELMVQIAKWPHQAPGIAAHQLLDARRQRISFWRRNTWKTVMAVVASVVALVVARFLGLS